ncbi:hypothetical protein DNU06_07630 [Putridiphycobacter roseus]|uniref:Uncharacterized protein n=1 Tax=Putridiphycobacter roseus TaxID=2219161 RepID=A0A2W1N3S0_9FLAO|nr:hypothetical protein DNU06_07630 [Putridiphycobacter roseus]
MSFSKVGESQERESEYVGFNKNALSTNIGIGGLYFTATGYYERLLQQNKWQKNISSFVKFGYGAEAHWGGGGMYMLAQYGIFTGAKIHHLEISTGPNFFISGDLKGDFAPWSAALGWRVQKPGGNFIFRMGAAWPEAIYTGLGVSF